MIEIENLHKTYRGRRGARVEALRGVSFSCEPGEVVVEEGKPADAVYLVRSGFMKISQRVGGGQMALSYISKGKSFGELELLIEDMDSWQFTVSSVGYGELVKIAREDFQRLMREYPGVEKMLWEQAVSRIKSTGSSKKSPEQSEFVQISLDQGLVEGNSILVIDLNAPGGAWGDPVAMARLRWVWRRRDVPWRSRS